MTKREFVNRVSVATGLPKVRLARAVDVLFAEIIDALVTDGRVEFRNFGVFRSVDLPARTGRNPRTGTPASRHVRFKAGKRMRDRLNP